MYSLRTAKVQDAKEIQALFRQSFERAFKTDTNASDLLSYLDSLSVEAFESLVRDEKMEFILCESENSLLGFAQLVIEKPKPSSQGLWIKLERLYVSPQKQGAGIGLQLLKEALKKGQEKNYEYLWLQVLERNEAADRFYRRQGFEQFGLSPGKFTADKANDLWLKVPLT